MRLKSHDKSLLLMNEMYSSVLEMFYILFEIDIMSVVVYIYIYMCSVTKTYLSQLR